MVNVLMHNANQAMHYSIRHFFCINPCHPSWAVPHAMHYKLVCIIALCIMSKCSLLKEQNSAAHNCLGILQGACPKQTKAFLGNYLFSIFSIHAPYSRMSCICGSH